MIWVQTCFACPQQYNIYTDSGKYVAYFRLRHGKLYVHPIKHNEIDWSADIFRKFYDDDRGYFSQEDKKEFAFLKFRINFRIYLYLFKQKLHL